MKKIFAVLCGIVFSIVAFASAERPIPQPLPNHPGNIFVAGEEVAVVLPKLNRTNATAWRLIDYDHKTVAEGAVEGERVELGKLPVGYYELRRLADGDKSRVTVGVVSPLTVSTPKTSPIGIDVAMAWFYLGEQQEQSANLCALAGVNWVRDRLAWETMEQEKGRFSAHNKYDDTARKQSEAHLQVLQVHHNSPSWAAKDGRRQPADLRDAYSFMKEMARRWKGQVLAFEPWNEADIDVFGGHTGSEMAALQKASYLGLKAGNPDVIVCQNVFATAQANILADLNDNRPWPYFDTFNLHHYCTPDAYPGVYAAFRAVSAGKPMWVTEFNAPVHWAGSEAEQEPTDQDLRVQSERVAQVFASSLHEGPAVAFYFMLPHYCEGQTQFGILHKDLTPRPAYLALATVGRILADARPLGRITTGAKTRAFAFRARPDGRERGVIVAWTTEGEATLDLPVPPTAVYDHLGRLQNKNSSSDIKIGAAPLFLFVDNGALAKLSLEPAPKPPEVKAGKPSTVILQALIPKEKSSLSLSAYQVSSEKPETFSIFAYNFGDQKVSGSLKAAVPEGWLVDFPTQVELLPGERKELTLTVDCTKGASALVETLRINGDFGTAGEAVLSMRLTPRPFKLREGMALNIPGANDSARWHPLISGGSEIKIEPGIGGLSVKAKLGAGDRWVYPLFTLAKEERPAADFDALVVTLTALEGQATYRAILDEENGSSYAIDLCPAPKPGETVEAIAVLSTGVLGQGWSKADDNGKLDLDKIKSFKIGCNTTGETVKFSFTNVRWVKISAPK